MAKQWLKAGAAAALLLLSADAAALHCDHKLIAEGTLRVEVERFCGEPVAVRRHYAPRALVNHDGRLLWLPGFQTEVLVEEWTYNFGPHRLMRVIRIEDGVVTDIEPLGYGFREKRNEQ